MGIEFSYFQSIVALILNQIINIAYMVLKIDTKIIVLLCVIQGVDE